MAEFEVMSSPPALGGRLATLLTAAVRAPSGDNMQPWRFEADGDSGRVEIHVDKTRDPSPMNAGQRMSRVAAGAALENLLVTATRNGWEATLHAAPPPALASIQLADIQGEAGTVPDRVAARVTNRRCYDGRPLPAEMLVRLQQATPPLHGVQTNWLANRDDWPAWADLMSRADAVMFGEASMRRAFLGNVRFDARGDAAVAEGLSPAALEMSWPQRLALRLIARLPDRAATWGRFPQQVARHTRRLAASASGLCLLTAPDDREATDVVVGRAMQRAWLALTGERLAVQPMMSLLVLENAADYGSVALRNSLGIERLQTIRDEFRRLAPPIGASRPAFLLRFGFAPPPQGRTGRLPLAAAGTAWAGTIPPWNSRPADQERNRRADRLPVME